MYKKIIKTVMWVIFLCVIVYGAFSTYSVISKRRIQTPISMEQFQENGEFQFDNLDWGMTVEDVNRVMKYPLKSNIHDTFYDKVTQFTSQTMYGIDEQGSVGYFLFDTGRLKQVQFSFNINEGYLEWFQERVEEARNLYGEESEKIELVDGPDNVNSIGYRWDTDNTTLQIIVMWGKTEEASVMVGVAQK